MYAIEHGSTAKVRFDNGDDYGCQMGDLPISPGNLPQDFLNKFMFYNTFFFKFYFYG